MQARGTVHEMDAFRFAQPLAFVLLLIPVLWGYLRWKGSMQLPALHYSDTRLAAGLPRGWRVRVRYLPDILKVLCWLLLVMALARPQGGRAQEVLRGQGVDIVLAVDISGSMGTPDFAPLNRLQAAQQVIAEFISRRSYDRIGLVVFGREAYHVVPPTLDYAALLRSLETLRLVTELDLIDGTALGLGLVSAGSMLRRSDAVSKVIILLTDGSNNAALDPLTAAEALAVLGIRVYTVGVGLPGGTAEGDLDEDTLRGVASLTGGLYFRAVDRSGLEEIYSRIDTLERSAVERRLFVRWQEYAGGWMVVALILLVLERLLRSTVFQSFP